MKRLLVSRSLFIDGYDFHAEGGCRVATWDDSERQLFITRAFKEEMYPLIESELERLNIHTHEQTGAGVEISDQG